MSNEFDKLTELAMELRMHAAELRHDGEYSVEAGKLIRVTDDLARLAEHLARSQQALAVALQELLHIAQKQHGRLEEVAGLLEAPASDHVS